MACLRSLTVLSVDIVIWSLSSDGPGRKGGERVASTLVLEAWAQEGREEAPFTLMTISDEEEESAGVVSDMVGRGKLCV